VSVNFVVYNSLFIVFTNRFKYGFYHSFKSFCDELLHIIINNTNNNLISDILDFGSIVQPNNKFAI